MVRALTVAESQRSAECWAPQEFAIALPTKHPIVKELAWNRLSHSSGQLDNRYGTKSQDPPSGQNGYLDFFLCKAETVHLPVASLLCTSSTVHPATSAATS